MEIKISNILGIVIKSNVLLVLEVMNGDYGNYTDLLAKATQEKCWRNIPSTAKCKYVVHLGLLANPVFFHRNIINFQANCYRKV